MLNNYAFIKNGIVVNIVVFDDPTEELLNLFKNNYNIDEIVLANDRCFIDGTYEELTFWPPKPFPSWTKNEELKVWAPPVPRPEVDDGSTDFYLWNESNLTWELQSDSYIEANESLRPPL